MKKNQDNVQGHDVTSSLEVFNFVHPVRDIRVLQQQMIEIEEMYGWLLG